MSRKVAGVVIVALICVSVGYAGFTLGQNNGEGYNDVEIVDNENRYIHATDDLTIHHIDVGQADATLVVTPDGETLLVDTGHWQDDGEVVIDYLDRHGIDRIDHLIATHAHADHIGGHADIIEHYTTERDGIGALYDSGFEHDTQTYAKYLDAVEQHDKDLYIVDETDGIPVEDDNVTIDVLNPPADSDRDDLHYNSVALMIEYGGVQYLTTGDIEQAGEMRLIDEYGDALDAEIYHAGHHGSHTSSTEPFMDVVQPELTVISSAYDSPFGHPHDRVLDRIAAQDTETYWTGIHGDITMTTAGQAVTVETTTNATTDAEDMKRVKPSNNGGGSQTSIASHVPTLSIDTQPDQSTTTPLHG